MASTSAPEGFAATPSPEKAAARPRSRARVVFPVLLAAAAAASLGYYVHGLGRESTDDAQVEGHVAQVSSRVPGQVKEVLVRDNQSVNEGDVIVSLDPSDYEVKVLSAKADLATANAALLQARAQVSLAEANADASLKQAKGGLTEANSTYGAARASIQLAEADVISAESRARLADADLGRAKALGQNGSIAQAEVDARQTAKDQASAALDVARARLLSARATAQGSSGGIASANGRLTSALAGPQQVEAAQAASAAAEAHVQQATAALSLAELNLSFTKIRAPRKGQIARRTVEVGQMVGPDRPLLAVVPLDDVWLVANFKESQLSEMSAGQSATITIDAFGNRPLRGKVDSIAGASGARFALIPPDNATGNFIKVVQRVPVLLRFDSTDGLSLRPGMSAEVTVITAK